MTLRAMDARHVVRTKSRSPTLSQIGSTNGSPVVSSFFAPSLGFHYIQAMEAAGSGLSTTLYGNGTVGMANQFEMLSAQMFL